LAVGIVAATLSAGLPRIYAAGEFEGPSPTTATCSHRKTGQLALGGPPSSCQRGDYATDNLLAQEQPEMADTADRYGLHFGVGRHRPQARYDHVERRRECQPTDARRQWRASDSPQ
jgi:hypothetical protein